MNNTKMIYLLLFFYSFYSYSNSKILIMTYVHSSPHFIELHDKTFKTFLKDEYEYVVFNDAPNLGMSRQMEETCKKLNVRCFRVPPHKPHRQSPGHRHMDGIQFSLEKIGYDYDGIVVMIDADLFPVKPFSIAEYLGANDLVGDIQFRADNTKLITYMSPLFVILNMNTLPNKKSISFEGGFIQGLPCDVGGSIYHYLKNNVNTENHVQLKFYQALSTNRLIKHKDNLSRLGYDDISIKFISALLSESKACGMQFIADNNLVHFYGGGSNWCNQPQVILQKKKLILIDYIDSAIKKYSK